MQNGEGLRFDTKDDALNYANKLVEGLHNWAVAQGVRAPREDYLEAQCEIHLDVQFTTRRKSRDFKLVMQVIPFVDDNLQWAGRLNNGLREGRWYPGIRPRLLFDAWSRRGCSSTTEFHHYPLHSVA